jgi:hypothetical protein
MSAVYLMLWSNASVRGITTEHGMHVFCLYDFMQHVLVHDANGRKSRTYVKKLFKTLCSENAQFMEIRKPLRPAVASTKMQVTPTPGMTVVGLQALLQALGQHVSATLRPCVEATLANYMLGDHSSVIEVDLEQAAHPQIPSFHPNFMPPYAVMIED